MTQWYSTRDRLLTILQKHPQGVTTREIWAQFPGRNIDGISGQLSKLAAYGQIDKEYMRATDGGEFRRWCVWKPKQETKS